MTPFGLTRSLRLLTERGGASVADPAPLSAGLAKESPKRKMPTTAATACVASERFTA
jgi:hypothetical protein